MLELEWFAMSEEKIEERHQDIKEGKLKLKKMSTLAKVEIEEVKVDTRK